MKFTYRKKDFEKTQKQNEAHYFDEYCEAFECLESFNINPTFLLKLKLHFNESQKITPLAEYGFSLLKDFLILQEILAERAEEELFAFWANSNRLNDYSNLSKTMDVFDASYRLSGELESELISFFERHIWGSNEHKTDIFEIGEDDLLVKEIINPNLTLFSSSKNQKIRILKALSKIKKVDKELYESFEFHTKVLIEITAPGVVSYSQQYLPGYSCINFIERDDIDLMDDLIHENGHHQINRILNIKNLIDNNCEENIYYSPWRETYRNIRGIFHAVITFYNAVKLFNSLYENYQEYKIAKRFCEEYLMIRYCEKIIMHAYKNNKVSIDGFKMVEGILKSVLAMNFDEKFIFLEENNSHREILILESLLKKTPHIL